MARVIAHFQAWRLYQRKNLVHIIHTGHIFNGNIYSQLFRRLGEHTKSRHPPVCYGGWLICSGGMEYACCYSVLLCGSKSIFIAVQQCFSRLTLCPNHIRLVEWKVKIFNFQPTPGQKIWLLLLGKILFVISFPPKQRHALKSCLSNHTEPLLKGDLITEPRLYCCTTHSFSHSSILEYILQNTGISMYCLYGCPSYIEKISTAPLDFLLP